MNIDIREYLRINPISVHDLTLSDKDTDCFLVFPTSGLRGYRVNTQSQLFLAIQRSIFGELLEFDETTQKPKINPNPSSGADAIEGKFKDYARKTYVEQSQNDFAQRFNNVNGGLETYI